VTVASFDRVRYRRHDGKVFLYAFDLIELNGDDLRREPLEVRKATLASVLAKVGPGLRLNDHLEHEDGEVVFRHACKLGLEGIVSKRTGSPYRSGRSPDWLKMKNPDAPGSFALAWISGAAIVCRPTAAALSSPNSDSALLMAAHRPALMRSPAREPQCCTSTTL
jgi:ATP-dependent DNA ligase